MEFLTDDEAAAYGIYTGPPSREELDRMFFLDDADRALVAKRRGDHTRLSFALQLTTVRFIGTFLPDPVGDIIADGPPGTAYYVVRQTEPGKSFVLFTDTHLRYLLPARLRDNPRLGIFGEVSDSFLLAEPEPGTTRVIRRMRLRCGPRPFPAYVVPIVLIWGEAITARNLLRGVKRRAETTRQQA